MNATENRPIVEMQKFIGEGIFGNVTWAYTPSMLREDLGEPDYVESPAEKVTIFRYGDFEILFENTRLSNVSCVPSENLNAGDGIELEPWIFDNTDCLTFADVTKELALAEIDFRVSYDGTFEMLEIEVEESGVCLYFEDFSGDYEDISTYELSSFGMWS